MMNNPLMMLIQTAKNGGNPMALLGQMAMQNPQAAQMMQLLNGKTPQQLQTMAQNMAKERGININDIVRQLGLR